MEMKTISVICEKGDWKDRAGARTVLGICTAGPQDVALLSQRAVCEQPEESKGGGR